MKEQIKLEREIVRQLENQKVAESRLPLHLMLNDTHGRTSKRKGEK